MFRTQAQQKSLPDLENAAPETVDSLRRENARLKQALEQQVLLTANVRGEAELRLLELAGENARLEALVTLDGLTGLKNRRAFEERLETKFQHAARNHAPLSVIMLDVDRFKPYNDMFGHPGGDIVLKSVAHLLKENAREADFTARYGGEEFAIIMPVDQESAIAAAERMRVLIEQATWPKRAITASFGVATMTEESVHYTESNALVVDADYALYYSKAHGRNRVAHAHDIMHEDAALSQYIAINAGGDDIPRSSFLADCHYKGGQPSLQVVFPMDVSKVKRPAPEEVYQSERFGNFTYTIPGLTGGACFQVRLHFSEFFAKQAGVRRFNVYIGGTPVLKNLDIFAECGAMYQALIKEFAAVVTEKGEIVIKFESVKELAKIGGIEIVPFRHNNHLAINCGGGAVTPFISDTFYQGGRIGAPPDERPLDMDDSTDIFPRRIYNQERHGDFTYTIPNLPPGASCLIQLHFCEIYWEKEDGRLFNVTINGIPALMNFDIFAVAAARFTPILRKFAAVADEEGKVVIVFNSVADDAQVSAIEVFW